MFDEKSPRAEFSRHVECYWQQKLRDFGENSLLDCLPPQGTFDLVFSPSEFILSQYNGKDYHHLKCAPGCYLLGQQTRSYQWSGNGETQMFGIRLKPFALFPSLVSPLELKNSLVQLDQVNRSNSANIDKILVALERGFSIDKQTQLFTQLSENLILELYGDAISNPFTTRELSNCIMLKRGNIRLESLCKAYQISKVTLRQKFLNSIGLLPKELCKVWRINQFLLSKQQSPDCSLTELGLLAGYYDQAHLNREFKSFFKQSPARYFANGESKRPEVFAQIDKRLNGHYAPVTPNKLVMT